MLEFMAKKPCRFQGKSYKIGDKIPETVINRKAISALIAMEIIEKIESAPLSSTPAYNELPAQSELLVQKEESLSQEEPPILAENNSDKKNKKKPPKVSESDEG